MSLGIGDPVTRASQGTEEAYYKNLAREVFRILETPVQVIKIIPKKII